ncbi:MAG: radical SAM family heme chaperone HemW [Ignavibacteriales bacterium]|nr:radical SAM family heme chaperone HemW [Ignavibacteriales bacterium]
MNASLYLHIPFCEHKCIYCDFYSLAPRGDGEGKEQALIRKFLVALESEILLRTADGRFRTTCDTVFFGGGTPSLLEPSNIATILDLLRAGFSVTEDAEITLETNPGTVDRQKLAAFRKAGVNRVSVGIQSFHEDDLRFLTRIHSAEQAKECVRNAFEAGFSNVSLDLMFALPGQTMDRWKENLEQAVALQPTHLSCYSLIVEPGTPLQRMVESKQVAPLPPELDAELYAMTIEVLAVHGFEQYEVSNFCKRGFQSRHNVKYWSRGNYLGFGPSAHSHWDGLRWWNIANLPTYLQRLSAGAFPVAGEELLTLEQRKDEEVYLGLRSTGLDLKRFSESHGVDLRNRFWDVIDRLVRAKLATADDHVLKLTPQGYAVCDEICCEFIR